MRNLNYSRHFRALDLFASDEIWDFLNDVGLRRGSYKVEAMASDASTRKYYRVVGNQQSRVLMDVRIEPEVAKSFVKVANFLSANSLRVPEIYHVDYSKGFALLEDFGENTLSKFLSPKYERLEMEIYTKAIEILEQLCLCNNDARLEEYDRSLLDEELKIFIDWYLADKLTAADMLTEASAALYSIFAKLYQDLVKLPSAVVLRDYHADNLMLLNGGELGLLDFQDAVWGFPCYDLVSLLEDARRDVHPEIIGAVKEKYYSAFSHIDYRELDKAYLILGLQRNLKIVGIFERLKKRDGKDRYQQYLPRVWKHIIHGLTHPFLKEAKDWFNFYQLI